MEQLADNFVRGDQLSTLCRLCGGNSGGQYIPILDGEGLERNLCAIIEKYVPIKISRSDELPLQICYQCTSTLLSWNNFYEECLLVDLQLRATLQLNQKKVVANNETEQNLNVMLVEDDHIEEYLDEVKEEKSTMEISSYSDNITTLVDDTVNASGNLADYRKFLLTLEMFRTRPRRVIPSGPEGMKTLLVEDPKRYSCAHCNSVFASRRGIIRHVTYTHPAIAVSDFVPYTNDYECVDCYRAFNSEVERRMHMVLVHDVDDSDLETEFLSMMPAIYDCDMCSKKYCNKKSFLYHKQTHTAVRFLQSVICEICNRWYANKKSLVNHQVVKHNIPRETLMPPKVDPLSQYICVVNNRNVLKCDHCEYRTNKRQRFRDHHSGHTNPQKQYTCDTCGKSFRLRQHIVHHFKITHRQGNKCVTIKKPTFLDAYVGEVQFPYICDICGVSFPQNSTLYAHRFSHENTKQYHCTECDMRFNYKQSYTLHMKRHFGENDFCCEECGKGFVDRKTLNRHKFVHATERPFVCECGADFKTKRYLQQHWKSHLKKGAYMLNEEWLDNIP